MKKIMFNDKYGLTEAVLKGHKTMTRRIIPIDLYNQTDWKAVAEGDFEAVVDGEGDYHDIRCCGTYKVGEEVAIAQSYNDVFDDFKGYKDKLKQLYKNLNPTKEAAWNNKMFVKASMMPHRIRIKSIKAERLQDISDEDCQKEGIIPITWRQWHKQDLNDLSPQRYTDYDVWTLPKFREGIENPWADSDPDEYMAETAKAAFAVLINKISGKGTWERNPWVFVYEFELIK